MDPISRCVRAKLALSARSGLRQAEHCYKEEKTMRRILAINMLYDAMAALASLEQN